MADSKTNGEIRARLDKLENLKFEMQVLRGAIYKQYHPQKHAERLADVLQDVIKLLADDAEREWRR